MTVCDKIEMHTFIVRLPLYFHGIFQIRYVLWMDSSNSMCTGIEMWREHWKLSRSILSGINVTRSHRTRYLTHISSRMRMEASLWRSEFKDQNDTSIWFENFGYLSSHSYISRTRQFGMLYLSYLLITCTMHKRVSSWQRTDFVSTDSWYSYCDCVRSLYPYVFTVASVRSLSFVSGVLLFPLNASYIILILIYANKQIVFLTDRWKWSHASRQYGGGYTQQIPRIWISFVLGYVHMKCDTACFSITSASIRAHFDSPPICILHRFTGVHRFNPEFVQNELLAR